MHAPMPPLRVSCFACLPCVRSYRYGPRDTLHHITPCWRTEVVLKAELIARPAGGWTGLYSAKAAGAAQAPRRPREARSPPIRVTIPSVIGSFLSSSIALLVFQPRRLRSRCRPPVSRFYPESPPVMLHVGHRTGDVVHAHGACSR